MFSKIIEIYDVLIQNEELKTGLLFWQEEDHLMKIDDSYVGRFYIREFGDRFGDHINLRPFEMTGCGGYMGIGHYIVVFCIDKCLNVEKALKILLYQLDSITGVVVKGAGTNAKAIYAFENNERLLSDLPFNVIKFTFDVEEPIDDLRNCQSLTLCQESCC